MSATVRVAVVQAAPVVLDAEASVDKACELIGEAGAGGARLIALPEVFVSLYPSSRWAHACARFTSGAAELHRRMWADAVDVPGPLTERLGAAARRARAWVAIGVNERDSARPGTMWNTLAVARSRRHPRPPAPQAAADAPRARLLGPGGRRRPGAPGHRHRAPRRAALLGELHARRAPAAAPRGRRLLPRPDGRRPRDLGGRDAGLRLRGRARSCSRRCSTCGAIDFPDDFPLPDELAACPDELLVGNSMIVDPWGTCWPGPVAGREEILYADCDIGAIIAARRVFDVAGHYRRPDIEEPEPLRAEAGTIPVAPGTDGDPRGG